MSTISQTAWDYASPSYLLRQLFLTVPYCPKLISDYSVALKVDQTHIFSELRKANQAKQVLRAVYWVHFVVSYVFPPPICAHSFSEDWKLYDSSNKQIFTSPEHHANHHVWKFATDISTTGKELEWKVVDLDFQVRNRLLKLHPTATGNLKPEELWEALV